CLCRCGAAFAPGYRMPTALTSQVPLIDARTAPSMVLRLAGVPQMTLDGAPLNTGTRKALTLTLLLVLETGQRRSRVADLLWPELDPAQARRNLRRELFRLRQLGLPVSDGAGDTLQLAGVTLQ